MPTLTTEFVCSQQQTELPTQQGVAASPRNLQHEISSTTQPSSAHGIDRVHMAQEHKSRAMQVETVNPHVSVLYRPQFQNHNMLPALHQEQQVIMHTGGRITPRQGQVDTKLSGQYPTQSEVSTAMLPGSGKHFNNQFHFTPINRSSQEMLGASGGFKSPRATNYGQSFAPAVNLSVARSTPATQLQSSHQTERGPSPVPTRLPSSPSPFQQSLQHQQVGKKDLFYICISLKDNRMWLQILASG